MVEFVCRVSIGIDREHASQLQPARAPAPIAVQTPRIGIDFDSHAMSRTCAEDTLHVDFVTGAAQQLAPRDMPENSRVRISNSAQNALRLLRLTHAIAAMHTCDHHVETVEDVGGIIEGAVR